MVKNITLLSAFASVIGGVFGCASSRQSSAVEIAPAGREVAFEAARDVLREYRFTLERVDAQAGVITTAPRDSAGLAMPWDTQQTHLSQDVSDFVNHQQRRVRVLVDTRVDVEVFIDRVHSPGLRVPARATALWSVTDDPRESSRGAGYQYTVTRERDVALERRIADRIERRMNERAAALSEATPAM
jgi:hypothetical protein